MILGLGKSASIDVVWSWGRRMRPTSGRVQHARGGHGRVLCWTTVRFGPGANGWGDGPKGYSVREPFRCETCGVLMDIRDSGLLYLTVAASHQMRAKRGLRVLR